jgi:hypothetical protein
MSAPDLAREVEAAARWLEEQAQHVPYGELGIRLILHAGAVSRIEKTVTSKTQPQVGNGHGRAG